MSAENTTHRLHNIVYANIEAVKNAEKVTRKALAELSRDLLTYVPESNDIDAVNRLIGVLTPMNRKTAIMFFTHMLPWSVEKDTHDEFVRFGKRFEKQKQVARKLGHIVEFLSNETNTIWTWAETNIEMELKTRNLADDLKKSVEKALKGTEASKTYEAAEPLSQADVIAAMLDAGVTLEAMLEAVTDITNPVIDLTLEQSA